MRKARTLLITIAALTLAGAGAKANPNYERLAAAQFKFDGTEFATATTAVNFPGQPDGALFFRGRVTPEPDSNVLFVSFYATGDEHGGAKSWFSCRLNGAPCRTSPPFAVDEAPNGWITLHHLPASPPTTNCNDGGGGPGDCHDNGIAYQWCVPIPKAGAPLTVDLRMATSNPGTLVFIEKGHVFIDAANMRGESRCAPAATEAESPLGLALKDAAEKGEEVARTRKRHEDQDQ